MPGVKRDGSSLRFRDGASDVTVTVLSSRIVRVALGGGEATPSYAADRQWAPVPFDLAEGEPLRVVTGDLGIEIATRPLRLSFLDPRGEWLLREPARRGDVLRGRRRLRPAPAPGLPGLLR
jgi:hypothetical protein